MYKLSDREFPSVSDYICRVLESATISISSLRDVGAVEMVNRGELEGWCWQSASILSVLFDDESLVSRGSLFFTVPRLKEYPHSWIEFVCDGKEYVFDPSFDELRERSTYYQEYAVLLKSKISGLVIRDSLIKLVNSNQVNSLYIPGTNNIDDPFYRTNSQVTVSISGNRIKRLNTRFYFNG